MIGLENPADSAPSYPADRQTDRQTDRRTAETGGFAPEGDSAENPTDSAPDADG